MRLWFSGRMRPCQGRDGSSILPSRTEEMRSKTVLISILILIILLAGFFLNRLIVKDYPVFTREQSFENFYNNKEAGYTLKYPKNWFLKDITFDSGDEISGKWENVVLLSDKPIIGGREAMSLPSYGLLVLFSINNSQIMDCQNIRGISEPAGKIFIAGRERERCLDIAANDTYVIQFEIGKNMYTFLYPKNLMDEVLVNKIISSFKISP